MKCKLCDRPRHARNLCITHYGQWRRNNREEVREYDRAYSRRRGTALNVLARRHAAELAHIMRQLESAERRERIRQLNAQILAERDTA